MIKRPRKVPYLLQGVLFAFGFFFGFTLLLHMVPLYKSIFLEDEYVFFGTPTALSVKSYVPGKLISFVDECDRFTFSLNGDSAKFILYLSQEDLKDLSAWFPVAYSENGMPQQSHMEVRAVRISLNEWIVTSLASKYGEIEENSLWTYHLRNAVLSLLWGTALFFMSIFFLCSMIRGFFTKRNRN